MVWKAHPAPQPGLRCFAVVFVDEPAEHIPPPDRAVPGASIERGRWRLPQALMRALVVVVREVGGRAPPQVLLADDEEVIEALLADGANPALRVGVRRWGPVGGAHDLDPLGGEHRIEPRREFGV